MKIVNFDSRGNHKRVTCNVNDMRFICLFQGDGSATSLVEGRGMHLQPNEGSSNPPAIFVTGKNTAVPKFVIYYKSRVMA